MITDEWTMNLLSWETLRFDVHLDFCEWTCGSGWVTRAGAQWLALSSPQFARAYPWRMCVRERVVVMRERVR